MKSLNLGVWEHTLFNSLLNGRGKRGSDLLSKHCKFKRYKWRESKEAK